jgi:hypothetical protein
MAKKQKRWHENLHVMGWTVTLFGLHVLGRVGEHHLASGVTGRRVISRSGQREERASNKFSCNELL